ncbi:PadR family transcriptional regulator [Nocardioides yefusunii]|uniref:PadR family transcriptional regulator n=1 Tax=Nocardioides yefusunii TaxID=2500546 RepID=A0ABW1R0D0_9ACTN|nr:PadR family transcriptional regulator [Nocardioides yefusunii]
MALEHALLVALVEKPGSGLELTRRFEKSFGYFWAATHQQIYRVLGRMVADGLLDVEVVAQDGRPDKKVYAVTDAGRAWIADWIGTPTPMETLRSDIAVKMRAASLGDREAVLRNVAAARDDHRVRLAHYRQLEAAYGDLSDLSRLDDVTRDQYLVLSGGIRMEEYLIAWLTDYLRAYGADT